MKFVKKKNQKLLFLIGALLILAPLTLATNGCNKIDPTCTADLVANCDVRENINFTNFTNTVYNLDDGIDICADNINLDFKGSTLNNTNPYIFSVNEEELAGIYLPGEYYEPSLYENFTIKNLNIRGFGLGLWAIESPNIFIDNVNVFDAQEGIWVEHSDNATIINSHGTNIYDYSFYICSETKSFRLENNVLNGFYNGGYYLCGNSSKTNIIINNSAKGYKDAKDTNHSVGFILEHLGNGEFNDNLAMENFRGMEVDSSNNTFSGNKFRNNFEHAHEYSGNGKNDWNDSGKGNSWDDLYSDRIFKKTNTKDKKLINLVYKILGIYDGTDYIPTSTVDNAPFKEVAEVMDSLEIIQDDLRVRRALDSLEGLNTKDRWNNDNELKNSRDIRRIQKAIWRLKKSHIADEEVQKLTLSLRGMALSKQLYFDDYSSFYLDKSKLDKPSRYIQSSRDVLKKGDDSLKAEKFIKASRTYVRAIRRADKGLRLLE